MQIRLAGDARRHLVIERSMLEDPRLSFRAKGLLAYLLAHPGIDLSDKRLLTSVSLEGTDAVGTALKELEDAGYFRRGQESDEDGSVRMLGIVYPASRIPVLEAQPASEKLTSQDAESSPAKDTAKKEAAASTPAQRIVDQLNELRKRAWDWARYTPISAKYAKNVEHINGRLADGYTEADLILVLEYLAAVDGGREDSRKYFDCVTPFNTKNFERNATMAREWEARGRPASESRSQKHLEQSHDPSIYDRGRRGGQR